MFHQPTTLREALELKARLGTRGRFLAGGTDLVVMMEKGRFHPEELVDLSRLGELATADGAGEVISIGSACPHRVLEAWSIRALAAAAASVGGPQIRNRGTVGGNVGTASPAGDVSVALLALDAIVELVSLRGTRSLPLRDFFLGVGRTAIAPDEMILGFRFPRPRASAWYKLGKRNAVAISLVCGAASMSAEGEVRLALGSVAPTPLRLARVEALLAEQGLGDEAIASAAALASEEVKPITDHRGSAEYRKAMAGAIVGRLLHAIRKEVSA